MYPMQRGATYTAEKQTYLPAYHEVTVSDFYMPFGRVLPNYLRSQRLG
jgi:hypothetical protein